MAEEEIELSGTLHAIIASIDGYFVGVLREGSEKVVGTMLSPQIGMTYRFTGLWSHHPRWGLQFSFRKYVAEYPVSPEGIERYLQHATWIGKTTAKVLVETYGDQAIKICKSDPSRIAAEVKGITLERALEIKKEFVERERNEQIEVSLLGLFHDIRMPTSAISSMIRRWGNEAPERVREDPYRLAETIFGIGFKTADLVARKIGFALDDPRRLRAGIVYALREFAQMNGHTMVPPSLLLEKASFLLSLPNMSVEPEVVKMTAEGKLIMKDMFLSLVYYYEAEQKIANSLRGLADSPMRTAGVMSEGLNPMQAEALGMAVRHGLSVITGSPGTGKTYTIKAVLRSLPYLRFVLCAPTGKAAKRIYEQTGMQAHTIHKLAYALMHPPEEKDRDKLEPPDWADFDSAKLKADFVIVDEVSMVDVDVMMMLLSILPKGAQLLLVGDAFQLPSVGPGNVLKDLIASKAFPMIELNEIVRQTDKTGLIVENCLRIKNGADVITADSGDFVFVSRDTEDAIKQTILAICEQIEKQEPLSKVQIITALREKTDLSCESLNLAMQQKFNCFHDAVKGTRFKISDRVIQTKNDYDRGVMNGEVGYVSDIQEKGRRIVVDFADPVRSVAFDFSNKLELAYAVTAHKFQGSEAPIVIIPIHKCLGNMVPQRNWLYTAISRAKDQCFIVGQRSELSAIIRRKAQQERHTRLARMLVSGK